MLGKIKMQTSKEARSRLRSGVFEFEEQDFPDAVEFEEIKRSMLGEHGKWESLGEGTW